MNNLRKSSIDVIGDIPNIREIIKTSDYKKIKESLHESENRLKKSQEIAHLGSWELDVVNNHLYWSDEVYRIFGLKPQEFKATYEAFLEGVHPDDRKAVDAAYSSSIRKDEDSYDIEHRVIRKSDGGIRYVHEKCEHIRDESGRIIRSLGMVHDITERKKLEEELTKRTAKLELLNRSLQEALVKEEALLESMGDAVMAVDQEGRIIALNKQSEKIFGWKAKNTLGQFFFKEFKLEDDAGRFIPRDLRPVQLALSTAKIVRGVYFLIKRGRKRIPLFITAAPITLQGQVVGSITIYRDISQQLAIDRAKDEFLYFASHTLKTPLSAIAWSIENLRDSKVGYSVKQKKALNQIYEQTQRLIKLANDLLEATKLEFGAISHKYEKMDPVTITSNVIKDLKHQIRDKKIKFKFVMDKNLHLYKTYSNAIYMILYNLLSNAIKFTPAGGKVGLKISKIDDQLNLRIWDSGVGIPPQAKEKIFQKLYRADNVKDKFEGSGLGLYIVSGIVDHIGGKITVESEPKKGAAFSITLPEIEVRSRKEAND